MLKKGVGSCRIAPAKADGEEAAHRDGHRGRNEDAAGHA